jgi:hypothetical protein
MRPTALDLETAAPRIAPAAAAPRIRWLLRPQVRIGFALLTVALFAASYTQPLWVSRFVAPQYPYGLRLEVYLTNVSGDTAEVDLLNHYVGLRPIHTMATLERSLALGALVGVCVLALAAACFRKSSWQTLLLLPLILFPVGMLIDLYSWLWYAGHSLDPDSALSMSIKEFTPKLIGTQRIANFEVTSGLGAGAWMQLSAALLLAGAAFVGWRLSRKP